MESEATRCQEHEGSRVCDEGIELREAWQQAEAPFSDPRPEAIEWFYERLQDARDAWIAHRKSCGLCSETKERKS